MGEMDTEGPEWWVGTPEVRGKRWSDGVWRRQGIQEMAGGYFGRTKRRHRGQGGLRGGQGDIGELERLEGDKEQRRKSGCTSPSGELPQG